MDFPITLLGVLLLSACTPAPFGPEPIHPSPARIAELLAQPLPNRGTLVPSTFELRVYPRVVVAGGGTWITCFVPERYGWGQIQYGIAGVSVRGPMTLEHTENRLFVDHIPCRTLVASCVAWTRIGVHRLTQDIEVLGC